MDSHIKSKDKEFSVKDKDTGVNSRVTAGSGAEAKLQFLALARDKMPGVRFDPARLVVTMLNVSLKG